MRKENLGIGSQQGARSRSRSPLSPPASQKPKVEAPKLESLASIIDHTTHGDCPAITVRYQDFQRIDGCTCPDPELVVTSSIVLYKKKITTENATHLDTRCHCCGGAIPH